MSEPPSHGWILGGIDSVHRIAKTLRDVITRPACWTCRIRCFVQDQLNHVQRNRLISEIESAQTNSIATGMVEVDVVVRIHKSAHRRRPEQTRDRYLLRHFHLLRLVLRSSARDAAGVAA